MTLSYGFNRRIFFLTKKVTHITLRAFNGIYLFDELILKQNNNLLQPIISSSVTEMYVELYFYLHPHSYCEF